MRAYKIHLFLGHEKTSHKWMDNSTNKAIVPRLKQTRVVFPFICRRLEKKFLSNKAKCIKSSPCASKLFCAKKRKKGERRKRVLWRKKSLWRQLSLDAEMKLAEITFGVRWNIPKLRLVFSLRRLSWCSANQKSNLNSSSMHQWLV